MVAAITSAPTSASDTDHARRSWSPDANDHLIFQWVKMQGKTQDSVATMLGISQPTVSRVIQRYERWQAHAREREGGRLDHCERLRAQRWLTYERNELLLASCLRIAGEMEGFTDVAKSTIRRQARSSEETEVSTQHATIDRSGVAARFLRLAFRINMEQLKLAELDPPPPAEPLSAEELAEQDLDAAAAAKEFADALRRATPPPDDSSRHRGTHEVGRCAVTPSESEALQEQPGEAEPPNPATPCHAQAREDPIEPTDQATPTAPSLNNVNSLNKADATQISATPMDPCSCVSQPRQRKNSPPRILDNGQPPWSHTGPPKQAKRRTATAAHQGRGQPRIKPGSACAS